MVKDLLKYKEKYGKVSKDTMERINILLRTMKPKEIDRLQENILHILSIRKEKLYLFFYMVPKPTPRPRSSFAGKVARFYVGEAGFNHKIFGEFIEGETSIRDLITTPCKIHMDCYVPMPSFNRINQCLAELRLLHPVSRPDVDNIAKTYLDMIQSHLLLEDSLVYDLHVRKFYSLKPRIELCIEYLENYDSGYNKNKIESWRLYKERK